MNKIDLILQDKLEEIERQGIEIGKNFINLYQESYAEEYVTIFSFLHQEFNKSFDFMNNKRWYNWHFNADDSRYLIWLIRFLKEIQDLLKKEWVWIIVSKDYQDYIDFSKTFLSPSWWSSIPKDWIQIIVQKYDPIFSLDNTRVELPNSMNKIVKKDMIGEWAFAFVYKYRDEFYNKYFAIKKLKKDVTEKEGERFFQEFDIMSKIKFPYILEVFNFDKENRQYFMEFCDFTLEKYIKLNNFSLNIENRKKIALQLLMALRFLYKQSILHRDLSLRNILINVFDDDVVVLKISDFWLFKNLDSNNTKTDSQIKGTYIDPTLEAFKDYNLSNEIYSIWRVLYFIFSWKENVRVVQDEWFSIYEKCTDNEIWNRYETIDEIIYDVKRL